ncbi:hypothetical protein [Bacillus sp. EB01]|uniref:hypothetical protein n=1 Tax=Bacillus sp. EB01 TaxID=1347086 RepID=UPI000AC25051|nr:hypothetical protein [Bacillus sp. EB01]
MNPALRKLGNLIVAARLSFKRLGRMVSSRNDEATVPVTQHRLEETATVWFAKTGKGDT